VTQLSFSSNDVKRSFASAAWSQGAAYQREGRVLDLTIGLGGRRLAAIVTGNRAEPYSVEISVRASGGRHVLDGNCTCPVRADCKHAAAAALEAIQRCGGGNGATRDPSDHAVDAWLHALSEAARRANPSIDRSPEQEIVYCIDVQERAFSPTFVVSASVIKRGAQIGWTANPRPFAIASLGYDSTGFLQASDLLIGRLLAADGGYTTLNTPKNPELIDVLLRSLMVTGRCYWRTFDNPPLRQGPVRTATLEWRVRPDGRQVPVCENVNDTTMLIPSAPPWYVDTTAWCSGPLDVGIPAPIAAAILHAPALAPEHVARLRRVLETDLDGLSVQAPRGAVETETIQEDPIPCLRLASRPIRTSAPSMYAWRRSGQAARDAVDLAQLRFDYDGILVDQRDGPDEFLRARGEDVARWPRRFAFEKRVADRLLEIGLERFTAAFEPESETQDSQFRFTLGSGDERWAWFLDTIVPELRAQGWRIEIDETFRHRLLSAAQPWRAELSEAENHWFELDLGIDVDGERIALLPAIVDALQRLPEATPEAIAALHDNVYGKLSNGAFVAIPADRLRMVLSTLVEIATRESLTADGRLAVTLAQAIDFEQFEESAQIEWFGGERLRALARSLRSFNGITELPAPRGLRGELRPYQRFGMSWLQFLREHDLGGILADDMGLGKTIQALAHILAEKEAGRCEAPCLIVAPTSVVANWRDEIARFAPGLHTVELHGPDRKERYAETTGADVVLTSYALLLRDRSELLEREWHIVVLDEAQAIKNPRAKLTRAARQLKAKQRLALTGTPIENHLDELWSLCTFVMPGLLGDHPRFTRVFRTPIEKHGDLERRKVLSSRLRPFMLRRTKDQVAADLPEKTEIVRHIDLVGGQRDLYETVRLAMHARVRQEVHTKGLARSRIVVLDALLKLRQVCCDPRLVKLTAARDVRESAKLELLLDMLPDLIEEGRRVLLFSQFTSMLDLIAPELRKLEIPFVELRGDTTDRRTPVARFQNREVPLFLISLKAGGTGLNLTAADTVIHYDPWWNPAVERQATDRAHRIGQDQHVFVYKLVTVGTVEEKIVEMQARKGALADAIFDTDHPVDKGLDAHDFEHLFEPL
jgi:superfamily II DNA or RNA helicase